MPATRLVAITDDHFRWMLGKTAAPDLALSLPAGGVDTSETLRIVRGMTRRLHAADCGGSWLIVSGNEVAGLCSYKQPPKDGTVEIGYGVAAAHRNQGHATRAVAAMLAYAQSDPDVRHVLAATADANLASQRILERNGFVQYGTGTDPDDGAMLLWKTDLTSAGI